MARRTDPEERDADDAGRNPSVGRRSARLRMKAAWMYYVEEMTQSQIADALGIGRVTVVRMLADAKALNEVKISVRRDGTEVARLEVGLEKAFGLRRAVVAPMTSADGDPTASIGAATGQHLSEIIRPGTTIGVGWGRTLLAALNFIDEAQVPELSVVSLLGGIAAVRRYNPAEFAWRFSRLLGADCYLVAAPALVDGPETKRVLVERCGVGEVFALAENLDVVVLGVGGMSQIASSFQFEHLSEADRLSLIRTGAVGDVLYNFFDRNGELVDHPINARVMSPPLAVLTRAPVRVLTSGGIDKVDALLGGLKLLKPTDFVTDENSARSLLRAVGWTAAADR